MGEGGGESLCTGRVNRNPPPAAGLPVGEAGPVSSPVGMVSLGGFLGDLGESGAFSIARLPAANASIASRPKRAILTLVIELTMPASQVVGPAILHSLISAGERRRRLTLDRRILYRR